MDVRDAKQLVLGATESEPWLVGVGIGLVGSSRQRGVVLSVSDDGRERAEFLVRELNLEVPVQIRVTGPIRARESTT